MNNGSSPIKNVALLGTGIMGAGMARTLLRHHYPLTLYNRTRSKAEIVAQSGGKIASCPAEAVETADVVITMLSDPQAVMQIVEGENGVLSSIRPGTVLIDCSTVSPAVTRHVHQLLRGRDAEMLDAPVFGSRDEAEKGELGIVVGGDPDVLARVRPVLDCLGRVNHIGGNGMGTSAKLALNLIMAGTLQVFHEGMILASKAGLDPEIMLELILASRARSGIIEMKAPQILQRNFTPFFPLHLMAKDMRLVQESAGAFGIALPVAEAVNRVYAECLESGLGNEDFCAAVKILESQSQLQLGGQPCSE